MEHHFLYIVERLSEQGKNTQHYSFIVLVSIRCSILTCFTMPVLRKDEFAYIFV